MACCNIVVRQSACTSTRTMLLSELTQQDNKTKTYLDSVSWMLAVQVPIYDTIYAQILSLPSLVLYSGMQQYQLGSGVALVMMVEACLLRLEYTLSFP